MAWRAGDVELVVSPEILGEYSRVGEVLRRRYEGVDLGPVLDLVATQVEVVDAPALREPLVTDPDDDKFFACAVAGGVSVVVSGDRAVRRASGWRGITVCSPRAFVDKYLGK